MFSLSGWICRLLWRASVWSHSRTGNGGAVASTAHISRCALALTCFHSHRLSIWWFQGTPHSRTEPVISLCFRGSNLLWVPSLLLVGSASSLAYTYRRFCGLLSSGSLALEGQVSGKDWSGSRSSRLWRTWRTKFSNPCSSGLWFRAKVHKPLEYEATVPQAWFTPLQGHCLLSCPSTLRPPQWIL